MNFAQQQKSNIEHLQYIENQKKNCTDLSSERNDSIRQIAVFLFSKTADNLDINLTDFLIGDSMEFLDIFCMIIELLLHGIDILTESKHNLFDLKSSTDDMVYNVRSYLISSGYDLIINEIQMESPVLYRDRNDYYCEIVPKPPIAFCQNDWCVLNYRMIVNKNFDDSENIHAFFIANSTIFTIRFNKINHY